MRTFTDHGLTVIAFDANVWLQERNLLRVADEQSQDGEPINLYRVAGTTATQYTLITTYSTDYHGKVVIDLSDYIRARSIDTDRRVAIENRVGNRVIIDFTAAGLINPESVIVPYAAARDIFNETFGTAYKSVVVPPARMLASIHANALLRGEFWPTDDMIDGVYVIDECEGGNDIPITREVVFAYNQDNWASFNDERSSDVIKRGTIYPLGCARYAAVRWQSFTGATRLHTFEVRDVNQATDEVIKLETEDGSYNQIKGRTDGFKLYLDDLNEYDFWYYADVITSSKVDVSLDGQTWQQVEVTTKTVTLPNTGAGALNKLEIAVNWRNYDAVTM